MTLTNGCWKQFKQKKISELPPLTSQRYEKKTFAQK